MSNVNTTPNSQPDLSALKAKLTDIITQITGIGGTGTPASPNSQSLNPQTLKVIAQRLDDLLPMLQFEKMRAENQRNWDLVDTVEDAVTQCEEALDSVNAAILRTTIVGLNSRDLAEMQAIRKQVKSALRLKDALGVAIQLAGIVRRLVL